MSILTGHKRKLSILEDMQMGSFGGVYITETRVAYDITKSMVLI